MKKFVLPFFLLTASVALSQIHKDFLIGINGDLIKSDQIGYFQRAQPGAEFNYFLSSKLTATAGLEYWTDNRKLSAVIGTRWYPVPEAFFRLRALGGANKVSIGGGWAKPISENWRFESMADFYFGGQIAIRVGFAYLFLQ